nr:hypothetical protein [Tanacetum cinerariifolium]
MFYQRRTKHVPLRRTIAITAGQQITLDNALVAPEKQVEIGKCNMRINPKKTQKEPTYQVVLDALALTTCYLAFLITASVPVIYMQQNPSEEEILSFIKEVGHTGNIKNINVIVVDHMHQPWRTFSLIINKCQSGKITGLDKIRLSRTQILLGMYYKRNIDYVALLWEDFSFQIDNRDTKKQEKIYYPRFTKAIIHHFLSKDKSISMRNRMFMYTAQDDSNLESRDDDDSNDDDVSDDDGNDDNSDDDGGDNYSDNERTKSDKDENPNLNPNDDDIEEEYVHTPKNYESTDDENEHVNKEEYDRIDEKLYKDVKVKLKDVEHEEKGKGDVEKTDAGHDDVTQETSYDQVEDDAHVTLTAIHDTQKTKVPLQRKAYSLKRDREDKDKDEDPLTGSDQGLKRRKARKDVEPSKGHKSKESKSSSSKGTKPPIPNSDWNVRKSVDFRPPQTWISKIDQAENPPLSFDELMSTHVDFSTYVMHHLKIDNLTQCVELDKPLPLIMDRGRQVVPIDYFINNDLEYLREGSSSKKYTNSTTKTKAAEYDIPGIEDIVPLL